MLVLKQSHGLQPADTFIIPLIDFKRQSNSEREQRRDGQKDPNRMWNVRNACGKISKIVCMYK